VGLVTAAALSQLTNRSISDEYIQNPGAVVKHQTVLEDSSEDVDAVAEGCSA
jgi:hypothetical protein